MGTVADDIMLWKHFNCLCTGWLTYFWHPRATAVCILYCSSKPPFKPFQIWVRSWYLVGRDRHINYISYTFICTVHICNNFAFTSYISLRNKATGIIVFIPSALFCLWLSHDVCMTDQILLGSRLCRNNASARIATNISVNVQVHANWRRRTLPQSPHPYF